MDFGLKDRVDQRGFWYLNAKFVACILLGVVATQVRAQAQPKSVKPDQPDFSSVRKLIQEQMAAKSIPSISVAVVRRGEITWEEGFGFADRENHVPATE